MIASLHLVSIALFVWMYPLTSSAAPSTLTLATTTSLENSGLLTYLLPQFTAQTGIVVHVISQGTGRALQTARNGDADAVLTHHPALERAFIKDEFAPERLPIMEGRFGLVGPANDPAMLNSAPNSVEAFKRLAAYGQQANKPVFVSRGDNSGTHYAEQKLWHETGIDPTPMSGHWYLETGAGMGATLNITAELNAYTLVDRATWLASGNTQYLQWIGDQITYPPNHYTVIIVSPARHPHTRHDEARAFVRWLLSNKGQAAVQTFYLRDEQPFWPISGQ
ncbi:MAG: substrate-binding domain-containing protein [Parvularculales bacterium]